MIAVGASDAPAISDVEDPETHALTKSVACDTSPLPLPSVEREELREGVVYNTVFEVSDSCSVSVLEHNEVGKAAPVMRSTISVAANRTFKVIHSSQTIQDIVNLDISRFRYTHERGLYNGMTSFTGWRLKNAWAGNLSWNHVTGSIYGTYTSSDTQYIASAYAHGSFHSDFLWCNLQPGQDFILYTRLKSMPTTYDVEFTQSRTCSGTHMATAKKMDTTYNQW